MSYSKRFAGVLSTGDASPLLVLSHRNKHHAMTALANYSKFIGCYDRFQEMKQRYGLKWTSGNESLQAMERFFNPSLSLDTMLQRIKEMIRKTPLLLVKLSSLPHLQDLEQMKRWNLSDC